MKTLFDSCDEERVGSIHINQLPGLLGRLGKEEGKLLDFFLACLIDCATHILCRFTDEVLKIIESCSKHADEAGGMVSFDQFMTVIKSLESESSPGAEGPDPKVVEFMRILEEYRVKCEEEGNYLEAGRAHKQLDILRVQEEKRQQKAIKVRQITERQDVQVTVHSGIADSYVTDRWCTSWPTTCSLVNSMPPGTSTWTSTTTWPRCTFSR